jgi:hypothetical protein
LQKTAEGTSAITQRRTIRVRSNAALSKESICWRRALSRRLAARPNATAMMMSPMALFSTKGRTTLEGTLSSSCASGCPLSWALHPDGSAAPRPGRIVFAAASPIRIATMVFNARRKNSLRATFPSTLAPSSARITATRISGGAMAPGRRRIRRAGKVERTGHRRGRPDADA